MIDTVLQLCDLCVFASLREIFRDTLFIHAFVVVTRRYVATALRGIAELTAL